LFSIISNHCTGETWPKRWPKRLERGGMRARGMPFIVMPRCVAAFHQLNLTIFKDCSISNLTDFKDFPRLF
jgi:hypothetical protein